MFRSTETAPPPGRRAAWRHGLPPDALPVIAVVWVLLVVSLTIRFGAAPVEDAAMLMRYAQHLADGSGLVWNVGDPPVDGATDFFYTIAVALVTRLGVSVEAAARAVSTASWVATVVIVYATARRVHRSGTLVAFLAAAAVAVSTASLYVSAGFGTPFFGMWAAALMTIAFRIRAGSRTTASGLALGAAWLLLGLTRPEGVLLGGFVVGALLLDVGLARVRVALCCAVAVMAVFGGAYFIWHWTYFGYPLPNPFYKKGGAALHWDGLRVSIRSFALFGAATAVLWFFAVRDRVTRRVAWFGLAPILLFVGCWVLLSPEMNFAARFQYVCVVLIAQSWPPLAAAPTWQSFIGRRPVAVAAVVWFLAASVAPSAFYWSMAASGANDDRAGVGRVLAEFGPPDGVVATTEAGLVPLLSGWRALDLWGLNDRAIAHRGYLSAEDLDAANPTVLFTHSPMAPGATPVPDAYLGETWTQMTVTAERWAKARGMLLVRSAAGPGGGAWNLWVRSDASPALQRQLACSTFPELPSAVPPTQLAVRCPS